MLANSIEDRHRVVGHECRVLVKLHKREALKQCFDRVPVGTDDLSTVVHTPRPSELNEVRGKSGLLECKVETRIGPPHGFFKTGQFGFVFK